jgi:hypothetical protein
MGRFIIEIDAVGGHGEARDVGDGGTLPVGEYPASSIDRAAFDVVEALRAANASISSARLIHWPGETSEVVDDLLTRTRKGSFGG